MKEGSATSGKFSSVTSTKRDRRARPKLSKLSLSMSYPFTCHVDVI